MAATVTALLGCDPAFAASLFKAGNTPVPDRPQYQTLVALTRSAGEGGSAEQVRCGSTRGCQRYVDDIFIVFLRGYRSCVETW